MIEILLNILTIVGIIFLGSISLTVIKKNKELNERIDKINEENEKIRRKKLGD